MKDRIRLVMESENLSPARFADTLNIGRAVISHILNGRNNPSLDVVTRILNEMPHLNSDWLLTGAGSMYKNIDVETNTTSIVDNNIVAPDLFSQMSGDSINTHNTSAETKYHKENIVNDHQNINKILYNESIKSKNTVNRKIKQIIIYYSDNTFETFGDK